MRCPWCNERPIPFREWCRGVNAFRTFCRHCGKPLKAGRGTWFGFFGAIAVLGISTPHSVHILELLGIDPAESDARFSVVVSLAALSAVGAWFISDYELAEEPVIAPGLDDHSIADPPELKKSSFLWSWGFVALLLLFLLVVPAAIVVTSYADLVLLPFGVRVEGRVVAAEQGSGTFFREGDWRLKYEFKVAGQRWRGIDVVPPAKMEPGLDRVTVRYVPWRPSISRIDSQVSWTAVVLVASVSALLWSLAGRPDGDQGASASDPRN